MTGFWNATITIAKLPLSFIFTFQKIKPDEQKLHRLKTLVGWACLLSVIILFNHLPQAEAGFMESLAIDPEAIAVANSVTANPPGTSSIHYNPAGLSLMGDGNYISMGLIPVFITKKSSFQKDPNSEEFHDFHGNVIQDPLNGSSGTNASGNVYIPLLDKTSPVLAAPVFGISHREPGSKWTFGYSAYVPYGGGWRCTNEGDPSAFGGRSVYLQHIIYAGPAVSYRFNNSFSAGAAFGLGQTAMGINLDMRAPNEIVNITKILGDATQGMANPIFDLTVPMPLFGGGVGPYDKIGTLTFDIRDDFSPSFNVGMLWEPYEWLAFGASYNSPVKAKLSGKFVFEYSRDWQRMVAWSGSTAIMQIISMVFDLPYEATSQQTGTVEANLEWPQMVNFGVKIKPVKRLSLMVDGHWSNWSTIKEDNIVFDQKVQLLQMAKFMGYTGGAYNMIMKRDLQDTLDWSVGIEYQLLDWMSLRAGYEKRNAAVQNQYYDLLYALPAMDRYGAGMGIKWKSIDIDLAIGYMFNNSLKIPNNGSVNMNSTQLGAGLNDPYRGLNYEQETSILEVGAKATMPLDMVTGIVYSGIDMVMPSKWKSSPKAVKTSGVKEPADASSKIINNIRHEGNFYYIEDSE